MYRKKFVVGNIEVAVGAWCPNSEAQQYGVSNWSLRPIQKQRDVGGNPSLVAGIHSALCKMGVHKAFAPNVVLSSAQIVESSLLEDKIKLGEHASLYRKQNLPADGVFLGKRQAFVMSGAGCPVIIATAGEYMVVAHAGRDSLINRGVVIGEPNREYISVVHTIVKALHDRKVPIHEITMCMHFAIPTMMFEHRFDNPSYGSYNQALASLINSRWPSGIRRKNNSSVFISLEDIFEEQARQMGIREVWTGNSLSELPALAHTHDGKDTRRRNLIVIKRCS
ncbi:MAG: hypothetical protein NTU85_01255 [Candidatus Kaiserbacteria bacterium]|nr:hypothetical protein [Candidatus Kaiserbacteria bacterium]